MWIKDCLSSEIYLENKRSKSMCRQNNIKNDLSS